MFSKLTMAPHYRHYVLLIIYQLAALRFIGSQPLKNDIGLFNVLNDSSHRLTENKVWHYSTWPSNLYHTKDSSPRVYFDPSGFTVVSISANDTVYVDSVLEFDITPEMPSRGDDLVSGTVDSAHQYTISFFIRPHCNKEKGSVLKSPNLLLEIDCAINSVVASFHSYSGSCFIAHNVSHPLNGTWTSIEIYYSITKCNMILSIDGFVRSDVVSHNLSQSESNESGRIRIGPSSGYLKTVEFSNFKFLISNRLRHQNFVYPPIGQSGKLRSKSLIF
ncbi:hypothetical protein ACOME3_008190 [Neoechinorhynchus agilis]